MDFYLMNKEVRVLCFRIQKTGSIDNYLVLDVYREDLIPRDFRNLYEWIDKRHILNYRNSITVFFRDLGIQSLADFIDISHCVSLTDTYWVKNVGSSVTWKSVSPYCNPLNKTIADYSFNRMVGGKHITGSPDFSTDGNFPKCWRRENGRLVLIKAGSSGARNAGWEPYSEVYACKIAEMLGIKSNQFVKYKLGTYRGVTVTRCECFTSEDIGLLSYSVVANTSETNFKTFLGDRVFDLNHKLDMLLLDYITCNVDRHYGNIGVLKDNNSNALLGLSPIYDNNLSCVPYYMTDESLNFYVNDVVAKDGSSWEDLFRLLYSTSPRYVYQRLLLFKNKYKPVKLSRQRDFIVDKMVKIQINRAFKIMTESER